VAEDLFDVIDAGTDESGAETAAAPGRGGVSPPPDSDEVPAAEGTARTSPAGVPAGKARVRLRVHVRPGAGRSAIVGRYGDALHVRVAAPPVDMRANRSLLELLADTLGLSSSQLELVGGERGPNKRIEISAIDVDGLRKKLHELVESADGGGQPAGKRRGRH
jgi:uncharacterized protein (TIGR00251 family)